MTPSFAFAPPSNEFADALRAGSPRKEAHQAGANSKSSLKRTNQSSSSLLFETLREQRTLAISPLALAKPTVGTASRNETLIVQGGAGAKPIYFSCPELMLHINRSILNTLKYFH